MKSEPNVFSIDDLRHLPKQTSPWDGVRNYQARNMLRDQIKKGDLAFFYHSSCEEPGIVGIIEVVKSGYPDFTAFDAEDHHYDPKSDPVNPTWYMVDVRFKRKLERPITLKELKANPQLSKLTLLRKGNRLSVMPVTEHDWEVILAME